MNTKKINTIAVIGAGIMGEGIAHSFAQAGLTVHLIDLNKEILENCLSRIDANLHLFDEFELLEDKPSSIISRVKLIPSKNIEEAAKDSDFIVETVTEAIEIKKAVFFDYVRPGDTLKLEAKIESITDEAASTTGKITCVEKLVTEIDLMFSHIDKNLEGKEFPEEEA